MNPGMTLQQNLSGALAGGVAFETKRRRAQRRVLVVLLFAVLVIVAESTAGMGHAQTAVWVRLALGPRADAGTIEVLNTFLRKCGHLTGFGFLGLIGERAARTFLARRAKARELLRSSWLTASVGIVFACGIGVCDEVHQSFLPTRHASVNDVALDTFGAVVFLAISACLGAVSEARRTRGPLRLVHMPATAA